MSALATTINPWVIDFDVDYHKTMAAVMVTCKAVKNKAWTISIAKDFWLLCRDFKAILSQLDQFGTLPIADVECLLLKLEDLYKTSNKTIDTATKAGLRNRTLTSASLQTFARCNDSLYDAIERFRLSLNPAVADAVRQAIQEYERGETVSLDPLV
jgi:hypothetical protein